MTMSIGDDIILAAYFEECLQRVSYSRIFMMAIGVLVSCIRKCVAMNVFK